jgi:hypothetical protein
MPLFTPYEMPSVLVAGANITHQVDVTNVRILAKLFLQFLDVAGRLTIALLKF